MIEVFIREIGLGFGYRYTLASIKAADQVNDVRKLLQELKRLAVTQSNLSDRRNWKVDLEAGWTKPALHRRTPRNDLADQYSKGPLRRLRRSRQK